MNTDYRVSVQDSHNREDKPICFPSSLFSEDKHVSVKMGKQFSKFLTTIEALYAIGAEAIEKFNRLELHLFDSLATDCACHMRALYIAYLAKTAMTESKFQEELKSNFTTLQAKQQQVKELCTSLGTMASAEKHKRFKELIGLFYKKPTVCETLQKLDLATSISANVHYLISAYLLTIVKDIKPISEADKVTCLVCGTLLTKKDNVFKEVTNPKALSDYARKLVGEGKEVTASLLEREVCLLAKKRLLEASASFILQATARSCSVLHGYFLEENRKMVQGKPELPDYYTLTAVFQYALYENIQVVLIINKYDHLGHVYRQAEAKSEIAILLVPSGDRAYFQPQKGSSAKIDPRSPVIMVVAKAAYDDASAYLQKLMSNFNFMKLCQLDGAQHKQYTDSPMQQRASSAIPSLKSEKFQKEAEKLRNLHEEAHRVGSSIHSPNANFILSHIFADTMGNYTNSNDTAKFDKAAGCFSRNVDGYGSKLKAAFRAADTRKFVNSFSFVTNPEEFRVPRSPFSMVAVAGGKTEQKVRRSISGPDLHHSLRSEKHETDESQKMPMFYAPVPIRQANQYFHFLSEPGYLTESQISDIAGRMSPILSDILLIISTKPQKSSGETFCPSPLMRELGRSPPLQDLL